jgi:hypothetical protein
LLSFAGPCAESPVAGFLSSPLIPANACRAFRRCCALNPAILESHAEKSSAPFEGHAARRQVDGP